MPNGEHRNDAFPTFHAPPSCFFYVFGLNVNPMMCLCRWFDWLKMKTRHFENTVSFSEKVGKASVFLHGEIY